jgi:hypothetical protein
VWQPEAEHGPVADKVLRLARHEALLLRASARQEAERGTRYRPRELPAGTPAADADAGTGPPEPPHPALHPAAGPTDDDTEPTAPDR